MLFGPASDRVSRTILQRVARTVNRLRNEGVGPLEIEHQIKVILAGYGVASHAMGSALQYVMSTLSSQSNLPAITEVEITPDGQTKKRPTSEDISPPAKKKLNMGNLRNEPDGDVEMSSSNSIVSTKGRVTGGETPISPYDWVQIGLPKTTTTKLPYYNKEIDLISAGALQCSTFAYRMNSIYDIKGTAAVTANPTPGADTTSGPIEVPKWRSYFADKYLYWTVLGCEYNVKVRVTSYHPSATADVFMYMTGAQNPPSQYKNGSNQFVPVPYDYKKLHPGVKYKRIRAQGVETTLPSTVTQLEWKENWAEFSGLVTKGDVKHEVVEDELMQTWNRMTEVPPTREQLVLHIQQSPGYESVEMSIEVFFEATYLTQFKDLQFQYQYCTPTTQFAAIPAPL